MTEVYRPSFVRRIASRAAASAGLRYYDLVHCERSLAAVPDTPETAIPIELRVADGNDVEAMLALRTGDERRVIEGIAQRGVGCVAAGSEGILGYAWARSGAMHLFCRRPLQYVEVAELPPNVSYTNNSYVRPPCRGQGIFQALLAFQYRVRAAQGFTTACNLIESSNRDSLAAHRRLGHKTQRARVLKLPMQPPKLSYPGPGPSWTATD